MIVGNGLIAKEFSTWKDREDVIIFASGVSNSKEDSLFEFKREFDLVQRYSRTSALFIYFSTCSIYDSTLAESAYVKHKLEIEEYIQLNFKRFLVLRLPNLVGRSDNPHTFFNFFYNSIKNGSEISVEKNSTRYFLDVEVLEPIIQFLVYDQAMNNNLINVAINNRVFIPEAVHIIEKLMSKKAKMKILDKGTPYVIPNHDFLAIQHKLLNSDYLSNHTLKCFQKYIKEKQNVVK
jgi:nucleoside-diphosphate-sugar epimerase